MSKNLITLDLLNNQDPEWNDRQKDYYCLNIYFSDNKQETYSTNSVVNISIPPYEYITLTKIWPEDLNGACSLAIRYNGKDRINLSGKLKSIFQGKASIYTDTNNPYPGLYYYLTGTYTTNDLDISE